MADEPKPPRKRWSTRKRVGMGLLFAFIALIVGLGLARWIWGVRADRALRQEIAAIRTTGEPLAWAELAGEPVPDEENAALLYLKAAAIPLFDGSGPAAAYDAAYLARLESMVDAWVFDNRKFRAEHHKEFRDVVALAAEPLELCRRARGLTEADWGLDFSGPAISAMIPSLHSVRQLAKPLGQAALAAHEDGRDSEATEYVRDCLGIARATERMSAIIAALVAMSIDAIACSHLEEMTGTLKIGDRPAATREQVRNLIRELLDERAVHEAFVRAIIVERAAMFDTFERIRRGEISIDQLGFTVTNLGNTKRTGPSLPGGAFSVAVFQPMLKLDEVRALRHMTQMVEAARQENWPAMSRKWPVLLPAKGALDRFSRMVSLMLMPSLNKIGVPYFRNIAMRRMAAVSLAIRLYEIDHGKRPGRLDDLVGDYLPAVPVDPFDTAGAPIRYLPDADPPVLYSINQDGKDDGGTAAADMEFLDLVHFLNGDRLQEEPWWQDPAVGAPDGMPFEIEGLSPGDSPLVPVPDGFPARGPEGAQPPSP